MNGIFTISLDLELHWGVFDKRDRQSRAACYKNTLQLIPKMLQLFTKYNVHVTWAAVGGLFAKDEEEWRELKPVIEPEYKSKKCSAYEWVKHNSLGSEYCWAHFAPEIIKTILEYSGQELGTHTFSHYYCMEDGKNPEAFREDLKAAKKAALKFNNHPVSLVFPRNQFNSHFLKTCYEAGIRTVRSNPANWFWTPVADSNSTLLRKIFRTGDTFIPIADCTSYPLSSIQIIAGEPLQLPACRLFRSWQPNFRYGNKLRLRRIIKEMQNAAASNECYHLWWHPENFGDYPKENMEDLEIILEEYRKCKDKYGMKSWNMREYAEHLL
ncbi:MAG: polysaccharide deacetylase family protein [Parafilimonas sp.]